MTGARGPPAQCRTLHLYGSLAKTMFLFLHSDRIFIPKGVADRHGQELWAPLAYCFTAPRVRPAMICRWKMRKRMTMGRAEMAAAAIWWT